MIDIDRIKYDNSYSGSDAHLGSSDKVIINFIDANRNLTLTVNEFASLLTHFPYGNSHRIAFAIAGCCGLRGVEVCRLTLNDFTKSDCSELKYVIAKSKPKKYKDTGTTVYNYKRRTVSLPSWLAKEVLWYVSNNYHTFVDKQLFGFSEHTFRRYIGFLRQDARVGLIKDPVLVNLLLDSARTSIVVGGKVTNAYRFTLHSLRRFYLTVKHTENLQLLGDALIRTQKDIGHTLKETTMAYLHNPEQVGLTEELIKKRKVFETLLDKSQKRLDDFE